eukprot:6203123-Pleurochrysis_carterae.AAC.3
MQLRHATTAGPGGKHQTANSRAAGRKLDLGPAVCSLKHRVVARPNYVGWYSEELHQVFRYRT